MNTTLAPSTTHFPTFSTVVHKIGGSLWFRGTKDYWERRYTAGRNSGAGSYGRLAEFKAEFINGFVRTHAIQSVMEFGCGDGNQLGLAEYPNYIGLDISAAAVAMCQQRFAEDATKRFAVIAADAASTRDLRADLTLSLDVIYHLVEEAVYEAYLSQVFDSADRFVIVYSSNSDAIPASPHVRHREFTRWVATERPNWQLVEHVPNRYPYNSRNRSETSFADFFVFAKSDAAPM